MDIAMISAMAILTTYAVVKAGAHIWAEIHARFIKNEASFNTATGFEQFGFASRHDCNKKLADTALELIHANGHEYEDELETIFHSIGNGLVTWVTISLEDDLKFINHSFHNLYYNSAVLKEEFFSGHETAEVCYRASYIWECETREIVFGVPHLTYDCDDQVRHRINFGLTALPYRIEFVNKKSDLPSDLDLPKKDNMGEYESIQIEHGTLICMANRYGQDSESVPPNQAFFTGQVVAVSDLSDLCDGYGFVVVTVKSQVFFINIIIRNDSLRRIPKIGQYTATSCTLTGTLRDIEVLCL
ncbi:MAG: hypothetical protein GF404_01045 [candidate division Zixibacteria bacterium]|nr:hypothetical protein [candidate division Zixibacteria bacterium]